MTSNSEQNKQKIQNTEKRKTSFSKKLVKNVCLAKKKEKEKQLTILLVITRSSCVVVFEQGFYFISDHCAISVYLASGSRS